MYRIIIIVGNSLRDMQLIINYEITMQQLIHSDYSCNLWTVRSSDVTEMSRVDADVTLFQIYAAATGNALSPIVGCDVTGTNNRFRGCWPQARLVVRRSLELVGQILPACPDKQQSAVTWCAQAPASNASPVYQWCDVIVTSCWMNEMCGGRAGVI